MLGSMKHLLKFAMGAALAGVLVNMLLKKQRTGEATSSMGEDRSADMTATADGPTDSYDENLSSTAGMSSAEDVVSETNALNGGNQEREGRDDQSQAWRAPPSGGF
jgi:hypothetical protein